MVCFVSFRVGTLRVGDDLGVRVIVSRRLVVERIKVNRFLVGDCSICLLVSFTLKVCGFFAFTRN